MSDKYPVIDVTPYRAVDFEQMGSKEKWWFVHPDLGMCMFKKAREKTGEDWSEKAAEQICGLLDLPHAKYELSTYGGQRGILTTTLLGEEWPLIHGNEIMHHIFSDYPKLEPLKRDFRLIQQYTIARVFEIVSVDLVKPPLIQRLKEFNGNATDIFVGYLTFDALIGNNDRHDQNWAIVFLTEKSSRRSFMMLAPTYDHASSLGRELSDGERAERLAGRDRRRTVATYAEKARSPFYANENDEKPLGVMEAFLEAARLRPKAAHYWAEKLAAIDESRFEALFNAFPDGYMSAEAIQFALQLMRFNKKRILEGVRDLK